MAEVIDQLVTRDDAEPAAKRAAVPFPAKILQTGGHGGEYLLDHVLGVRPAHVPFPAPEVHQRHVKMQEAAPSLGLSAADALEEGKRRRVARHEGILDPDATVTGNRYLIGKRKAGHA